MATETAETAEPVEIHEKGVVARLSGRRPHGLALLRTEPHAARRPLHPGVLLVVAIFGAVDRAGGPDGDRRSTPADPAPPSLHPFHPLGTDENGADMLSLLVLGTRISLTVGFAAALVSAVIGGVRRHRRRATTAAALDKVLTAIDDWFLVIPFLPLAIVLVSLLGRARRHLAGRQARDHHLRDRDNRLGRHLPHHPQPGAVGEGAHVRGALPGARRQPPLDPAQADPAQRAAADLRQHRADRGALDPVRVDALVPRAWATSASRRGARCWIRPTNPAPCRVAPGGTSSRPGSASAPW